MANLIENGSINSVIKEYRESKKLYSHSYTMRILNQLDRDDSLEISKIFREIMFKILKKNKFSNKGFIVAIDITIKPFYGNKKLCMAKGCKNKSGTNQGIHYLTASLVEEGVRFNLLCIPISSLTSVKRKVEEMIKEIEKIVSIKLLFFDRGFGNGIYSRIINNLRHKFCSPITKNDKLKEIKESIKRQSKPRKDKYDIIVMDYTFSENRSIEYQEKVKLIALHENNEIYFFITNIYNLSMENYYNLISAYRYRWGIETNYRVDNIFNPLTSSIKATIRYMLMQVSMIIQDLWTLVNFLFHDEDKKQPREKFKKDSLTSIIKARVKKLDFIWRPIITAVQFKRQMGAIFT
ncbi:MAG: transposase [Nanoarchaeota archaeon]|nr:transposase [Nanoarchaeota archaeon]MBU4116304.1 transposase [Nanoarchaeota archaeon]